ncbi:MAG TPA: lipoprotein-releasing ABC transporter permease subunit [Thiolinea sp.]|mgnify:FL=1|nr:lipoprotein-releasing ABC transporter permease subunit [Thiolinea sp.]
MSKPFLPLELYIGLRYTRARRQNHFVSFISLASMLGIAIGVLVLITVLSVMNGFEVTLRDRMLGMLAHVTISEDDAQLDAAETKSIHETLQSYPYVKAISEFIEKPVMLNQGDEARGVLLQAILPEQETKVADVFKHVEKGDMMALTPGSNGIAIGAGLAKELKVDVGDALTLISPNEDILDTSELPVLQRFTIKAIFRVDMRNYDTGFAYVNLKDAQQALGMGETVTGLRLRLTDAWRAPKVADDIYNRLLNDYPNLWVGDWTHQQSNFFKALQIQKSVMFIILMLIIAVAAFNLVSTLVMVVTDKEANIAILRTLGLSPARIMGVFMVQGSLIGVIGTLLGVVLGVLLASNLETIVPWLERLFDTHFISADAYQISELQSKVNPGDVILIAISSLLMAIVATLYPAWRASKVQPAEALRYE